MARPITPKAHIPPLTDIRAPPPRPKRLSRKTLMAGALILSSVVALALFNGFSDRPSRAGQGEEAKPVQPALAPERVRIAPAEYSADDLSPPIADEERDYFWGDHRPARQDAAPEADAETLRAQPAPSLRDTEAEAARISSIRFGVPTRPSSASQVQAAAPSRPGAAFVANERGGDDGVLEASYRPPRSPYLIQAGSTIPAALLTALNSDRPGRVIAQVTEDIYDSVTGAHLLVPQGARLIGTYDAEPAHGDQRLLIAWNRLIMPNGWAIALRGMPATDASGASGVRDSVDAHLERIAVASLLSGALSIAANEAESGDEGRLTESVGDAAAQEAARVGGRIIGRELDVRPTLRIRAGAPVRVLVSEDIVLRPYLR